MKTPKSFQSKSQTQSIANDPSRVFAVDQRASVVAGQQLQQKIDERLSLNNRLFLKVGNGQALPSTLQRKVSYDQKNKKLDKVDRYDFAADLQKAMPVKSGEHRCHTISYGFICNGVKGPINEFLAGKSNVNWVQKMLTGILKTIFPFAGTSRVYSTEPALVAVAQKYYNNATIAIIEILNILNGKQASLEDAANELINALNNSPDNLRPGLGNTNSSIQEGLDLTMVGTEDLAKGAKVTFDGKKINVLTQPRTVIRVSQLHEQQVFKLLTETYGESGIVYLYSSGKKLQSSDEKQVMKSSTMTNKNPTSVAIPWTSGVMRLFDLS